MQWKGGGVEPPLPNFQKEVGRLGQYISFSREFAGKKWVTIFRWGEGGDLGGILTVIFFQIMLIEVLKSCEK